MKKLLLSLGLMLAGVMGNAQSTDTISVMAYNLLKFPQQSPGRIDTLKNILQYSLPDLLMVCELSSSSGANAILNDALNVGSVSYYSKTTYVPGTDTENMVYFNSDKLGLADENVISTDLRDINEYVLYYKSTDIATTSDTTFFYVYVAHLKAGETETALRNDMALDMKEFMASKSHLENVLCGGDFNLYGSSEPAWNTILTGAGVNLVDPINTPGDWHTDWGYADIHTQSTRTTNIDNGATGGLDDRFDFIFISPDLQNWSNQAKYVDGSYWAYGQDGNHYNDALIDAPTNTSLPYNIIEDLHAMSDHLPVYMEVAVQTSFNSLNQEDIQLNAFYNSTDNSLFISSHDMDQLGTFSIYDLSGRAVLRLVDVDSESKISVRLLENGAYILKSDNYNFTLKFVK